MPTAVAVDIASQIDSELAEKSGEVLVSTRSVLASRSVPLGPNQQCDVEWSSGAW